MSNHRSNVKKLDELKTNMHVNSSSTTAELERLKEKTALLQHSIEHDHSFALDKVHILDEHRRTAALNVLEMCHIITTDHTAPKGINGESRSLWFIGLEFNKSFNLNVDLTQTILSFTDAAYKRARRIMLLKVDMYVEVRHIRRKQLSQYVDANLLKLDRNNNNSGEELVVNTSSTQDTATRKRPSSEIGDTATAMIDKKPKKETREGLSNPELWDLLEFDL
ncbi:poly(A) polymerase alpha-like [Sabethes cyaneus]|uniref:poly(A) polymerase alpha-like n=1 Tax=Sabethes cyaneus TaxID=53552 RepID=UPI00237D8943|nr:poly(A) polymerase alpha-like [Sabethes cyaneus]